MRCLTRMVRCMSKRAHRDYLDWPPLLLGCLARSEDAGSVVAPAVLKLGRQTASPEQQRVYVEAMEKYFGTLTEEDLKHRSSEVLSQVRCPCLPGASRTAGWHRQGNSRAG